jgi:pimeloyl-ACP methyl ester carboxylesterase
MQGVEDQYGTGAQIKVIEEKCRAPVEVTMLPGVQHSPHREAPDATVARIAEFVARLA